MLALYDGNVNMRSGLVRVRSPSQHEDRRTENWMHTNIPIRHATIARAKINVPFTYPGFIP